jgi:hypothetical protein
MLVQSDLIETPLQGFFVLIKDIVNYTTDYLRYVHFGATTLNIGSF